MKNKNIIIIILIAILLLAIVGVYLIKRTPNTNNNPTQPSQETENNKDSDTLFGLKYSGETVEYNAYDFIMEKMSQAQYWTYDQYHPKYFVADKSHTYDDNIINGTGWILYDEDTASFVRGYESRLIINFSDYTAESDEDFADTFQRYEGNLPGNDPVDIVNGEVYNGYITYIDFNKGTDKHGYITDDISEYYDRDLDFYVHHGIGLPGSYEEEIYNTFEFYDSIFSELGIPLLNQPVGTLASYKNKTIKVPKELIEIKYWERFNDDKIHSPYDERVGFDYYWERNKDNIWLDDYRDIMDKQFPESTENELKSFYFVDLDKDKTYNYYAPLFLCLADRQEHTFEDNVVWNYKFTGTYSEWDMDSDILMGSSGSTGAALTTYWLRPLYKHIFGFDGVYFYDAYKTENNPNEVNKSLTLDQFNKGIKGKNNEIVSVFNKGDFATNSSYTLDINWLNALTYYMNELCEHYNVESPYGNDFVYNMYLIYNPCEQEHLGLR